MSCKMKSQIPSLLDHRRVVLVLQIQPGFAELLRKGQTAPVQAVLDGTDSNTRVDRRRIHQSDRDSICRRTINCNWPTG